MTEPFVDIEPLEPELWCTALERLSQRQKAESGSVENHLRHAFHLVQLAPEPLRSVVRCELDEAAFEKLLDCGAFDSAAAALAGPAAGSVPGCAVGNGQWPFPAAVRLPGQSKPPVGARLEDLACDLLGAWTASLLALTQRSTENLLPRPVLRRPPVELRRKSIEP